MAVNNNNKLVIKDRDAFIQALEDLVEQNDQWDTNDILNLISKHEVKKKVVDPDHVTRSNGFNLFMAENKPQFTDEAEEAGVTLRAYTKMQWDTLKDVREEYRSKAKEQNKKNGIKTKAELKEEKALNGYRLFLKEHGVTTDWKGKLTEKQREEYCRRAKEHNEEHGLMTVAEKKAKEKKSKKTTKSKVVKDDDSESSDQETATESGSDSDQIVEMPKKAKAVPKTLKKRGGKRGGK
jgi:ribosome recycling factor